MNKSQQEAMCVVDRAAKGPDGHAVLHRDQAIAIIDLLANPAITDEMRGVVTMPAEADKEALEAMWGAYHRAPDVPPAEVFRSVYRALYGHLRKPATREWFTVGYGTHGNVLYSNTARTEAGREANARDAWAVDGCVQVGVVAREVAK